MLGASPFEIGRGAFFGSFQLFAFLFVLAFFFQPERFNNFFQLFRDLQIFSLVLSGGALIDVGVADGFRQLVSGGHHLVAAALTGHGLLELAHPAAKLTADFRQPLGAEHEQHYDYENRDVPRVVKAHMRESSACRARRSQPSPHAPCARAARRRTP